MGLMHDNDWTSGPDSGEEPIFEDEPYKYQPLVGEREDSVRILRLSPAEPDGPIGLHGELIEARLSDLPDFEAISYVWGEPVFSDTLRLPTGVLRITANLATALRFFRKYSATRDLWADAVCINQSDLEEKANQVARIGPVFQTARQVLGWLGEGDARSTQILALMSDIAATTETFFCGESAFKSDYMSQILQTMRSGDQTYSKLLGAVDIQSLNPLGWAQSQDWFKRRWIFQEAVLAQKLILSSGASRINFMDLTLALIVLAIHQLSKPTVASLIENSLVDTIDSSYIVDIVRARDSWRMRSKADLTKNGTALAMPRMLDFVAVHATECSDKRDLIYSLFGLGLLEDECSQSPFSLRVDYTKPVPLVFLEFAKACIASHDLRLLHFVRPSTPGQSSRENSSTSISTWLSLPSWCPDWTRARRRNTHFDKKFQAGLQLSLKIDIDVQDNVLWTSGLLIDMISCAENVVMDHVEAFVSYEHQEVASRRLLELRSIHTQKTNQMSYFNGEDSLRAFCQTFRCGESLSPEVSAKNWPILAKTLRREVSAATRNDATDTKMRLDGAVGHDTADKHHNEELFLKSFRRRLHVERLLDRCFLVTENGYIGLGLCGCEPGDSVILIAGASVPYVVRQVAGTSHFRIIGECYLHGFMLGELFNEEHRDLFNRCSKVTPPRFGIV